jgi:hypothetical protein
MTNKTTAANPPVIIPWPCLSQSMNDNPPLQISPPIQQRSFAQALTNVCDIPLSQLPKACVKGDRVAIAIPEKDYLAGIDACKHNLHGRIILPKGSPPLSIDGLRSKLSVLWKSIGKWGLTSLGKGFFEFSFSTLEDMRCVRSVSAWNLSPGLLKLFAWTTDFNPGVQKQTSAQVWIRIFGLSQEYWRQNILFAIASSIGTPICTDAYTNKPMMERTFGHYARVLVDVDLAKDLIYRVLVERKGFAFFVDVEYENLPPFCDHCNIIGHKFENCKRRKDAPKKVISEHAKHNVSVQPKDKVDEIIDIEGSTSKQYTQVNHAQERLDADKVLEEEINKETVDVTSTPEDLPSADIVVHDNPAENIVETLQNSISSEQSEFVDNTQVTQDGNVKSQDHVDSVHIPLLVHNDIQFLKESWANLAELE